MTWKDIIKSIFDEKDTEIQGFDYTIKRLKEEYDEYYETTLYGDADGEDRTTEEYYEKYFEAMKEQNLEPFPKETEQRILKYYRMELELHYAKEQLIKDLKDLRNHIEEFGGE